MNKQTNLDTDLTSHKTKLQWIRDLNINRKTIKTSKREYMRKSL